MSNLTKEAIEAIEKEFPTLAINGQYNHNRRSGAAQALTNPTIYQAAGLMTVEQAKEMATKEYWRGWNDYGESL